MKLEQIIDVSRETIRMIDSLNDPRPAWIQALPWAHEPYYLFLWNLVKHLKPQQSFEIGTRRGTSAFCLADGYHEGRVLTLDVDVSCAEEVGRLSAEHGIHNLSAMIGDSSMVMSEIPKDLDLLFIDGDHTYASSYRDYINYREHLRDGGLIVFDDTRYGEEMARAWTKIADPKVELVELHYTGFGVAIKSSVVPEAL
jgi:predicted O-methyltransferase YrrM